MKFWKWVSWKHETFFLDNIDKKRYRNKCWKLKQMWHNNNARGFLCIQETMSLLQNLPVISRMLLLLYTACPTISGTILYGLPIGQNRKDLYIWWHLIRYIFFYKQTNKNVLISVKIARRTTGAKGNYL